MKKNLLPALLFCLVASTGMAQTPAGNSPKPALQTTPQPKGSGRVSGRVVEAETNKPIEFATVAVMLPEGEKIIDGAMCDEKGRFEIKGLAPGTYRLLVNFLGFESKTIADIKVESGEKNTGDITLKSQAEKLGEVNVVTERELFENKIDRIVYNAEKDVSNSNGNAADVLKKVPQVTVDLDGNVQLRGSSSIRVLINNKPSSIMAASIADALKQIPADMIKSVEVITSPSAKYDAEGTAGIINIITKKNNLQGLSGSVNASAGNLSRNSGASVNYRRGKIGFNTNLGYNDWGVQGDGFTRRNDRFEGQENALLQESEFHNYGGHYYLQFGTDYDLNEKNSLNAGIRANRSSWGNENDLYSAYYVNNVLRHQYRRAIDAENVNNSYDLNLGYTRYFTKPQQELSLLALYSKSARESDYFLNQTNPENQLTYRENNPNENTNTETNFQVDYVQPFENKTQLEIGSKAILRRVTSDYRFNYDSLETKGGLIPDLARSDLFRYDQNVAASYASYGFKLLKKVDFKLGGRYEHTFIDADFKSTGNRFGHDYYNFMPNVMVAKDLKENQKLRLTYSRRIQRPMIFYLNPYVNAADPRNISYGNPTLDPELTNAYELGYNTFSKAGSVNYSLYWRQTNNAIESIRFVTPEGVAVSTFQNIAKNNTVGLSLFGNRKFFEKLSVSGNLNFFYMHLKSAALQTTNANVQANVNMNINYQFKNGWGLEPFGFYNSPRAQLQGVASSMRYYNFSVKKDILKKKGTISFGGDNIFETFTPVRNEYSTPNTDFLSQMEFYRRGLRAGFSYNFGKMEFGQQKRKKSIRNDDVKGDQQSN